MVRNHDKDMMLAKFMVVFEALKRDKMLALSFCHLNCNIQVILSLIHGSLLVRVHFNVFVQLCDIHKNTCR